MSQSLDPGMFMVTDIDDTFEVFRMHCTSLCISVFENIVHQLAFHQSLSL